MALTEYEKTYRKVKRRINALEKKIGKTSVVSNFLYRYANIGGLPNEKAATERGIENAVLRDMQNFLEKPTTITAYKKMRKNKIRTFHEFGYTHINEENLEKAVEALEMLRDSLSTVPSDELLEALDDPAQFDTYMGDIMENVSARSYISMLDGFGKEVKFNDDSL